MTAAVLNRHQVSVEDVEYLRHGDQPLLARVYQPSGPGPFPLLVDLHGGAWCRKDRTTDEPMDAAIAASGVVVAALDFRMPPVARFPGSLIDVNYAMRWFKANAGRFRARADRVGILGVSSGGHQAMLTALRPADPRYATVPLAAGKAFDASPHCVVLCWPVIDPLGRYHYAHERRAAGDAKVADSVLPCHDLYWPGEAEMGEANPVRLLERGEPIPATPPVLYLQGTADAAHPRPHLDRFIDAYGKRGGRVELHFYEGMGEAFVTSDPTAPASQQAIAHMVEFLAREMA